MKDKISTPKEKRKEQDPITAILRKFAMVLAKRLEKTRISPNQLTVLNFFIFVPPILWLISLGQYKYYIIALGLLFVDSVFDLVDGSLARLRGTSSKCGQQLDRNLDVIFQLLFFCFLIYGVVRATGQSSWFIWGMGVLFGQSMANWMGQIYERDFKFHIFRGSSDFRERTAAVKLGFLDSYLSNIIVAQKGFFLIFFNARYIVLVAMLINKVHFFLICYGVAVNIRWLTMLWLYITFLRGADSKLQTIRILREIYTDDEKNFRK